ncbi:hypothetical protein NQD34_015294 [Periophthalmus magnuspinnatus]|nr:hypothetical protein NQD34_015294 [Periophthalmus magnuspinnatus]
MSLFLNLPPAPSLPLSAAAPALFLHPGSDCHHRAYLRASLPSRSYLRRSRTRGGGRGPTACPRRSGPSLGGEPGLRSAEGRAQPQNYGLELKVGQTFDSNAESGTGPGVTKGRGSESLNGAKTFNEEVGHFRSRITTRRA